MDIISLYENVRFLINKDENGVLPYVTFNKLVKRASIRLLNYLTGGTDGMQPPFTYSTEKAKGFVASLITPLPQQVINGLMPKPDDYYSFENLYTMQLIDAGCEPPKDCNVQVFIEDNILYKPVELLDGQQFNVRAATNIEMLKPKNKPIAKEVGLNFEFLPKDIGTARLDYIRYPIFGEVKSVYDPTYNDEIADPATSIDNEFGEWAREMLIFFMTDSFANKTSQQSLKQNNILTAQLPGK